MRTGTTDAKAAVSIDDGRPAHAPTLAIRVSPALLRGPADTTRAPITRQPLAPGRGAAIGRGPPGRNALQRQESAHQG
ncbi:MAG: hypothetical protein WDN49_07325 [Acetobacteraceae bacterium]